MADTKKEPVRSKFLGRNLIMDPLDVNTLTEIPLRGRCPTCRCEVTVPCERCKDGADKAKTIAATAERTTTERI